MSRWLNTPVPSQWGGSASGGGAAARRAAKQRVAAAAADQISTAAALRAFAAEGSAATIGGGATGGAPFSALGMTRSQRNKARIKRRKVEAAIGLTPGALSGAEIQSGALSAMVKATKGNKPGNSSEAKRNSEIRMLAERRDVAAAFRSLEELLLNGMRLHDTTVAMLITLCLKVARQPERIHELAQALRSSATPLDAYSLLAGLSSISQLCAAGTDSPAEESVDAIIQAVFGANGLAQSLQLSQTIAGGARSTTDAARAHVLHQSKLLVMEFLGGAVSEFNRIATTSLDDLVHRGLALGPNLCFGNISPDGLSVSILVQHHGWRTGFSPFNKGDAVLLSGRRPAPGDPGLEQIEQIEGEVANAMPLKLALREPIPEVSDHTRALWLWRTRLCCAQMANLVLSSLPVCGMYPRIESGWHRQVTHSPLMLRERWTGIYIESTQSWPDDDDHRCSMALGQDWDESCFRAQHHGAKKDAAQCRAYTRRAGCEARGERRPGFADPLSQRIDGSYKRLGCLWWRRNRGGGVAAWV